MKLKKLLGNKNLLLALALLGGGVIGWLIKPTGNSGSMESHNPEEISQTETWTCSMHPQIRQPEPGKCPLCGMDLIPVGNDEGDDNPMAIRMSPTAMQLADVQTATVKKQKAIKTLRLNGKVQVDERYVSTQTSHISGRVEKLLVNFTGEYVRKGQVIAHIYSPDLVTAQEELFEAHKIRESQPVLYKASRDKLKNWKLTDDQIDEIIKQGKPIENFPILSDLSGVITSKRVNLGDHVMQGAGLFEVANLSRLWVLFDVYESDIAWVKVGDEVEYTVQSLPGEKFHGKISFIDPVINPKTRVAKARVNMDNSKRRLKPEMFVSGKLESPLPGGEEVIIVPKSAVMWTGERSVVYVKSKGSKSLDFVMREVRLGPSLGESYSLVEGLEEQEEIAIHGTFSIDAAAQLAGKPSMMSPEGGTTMMGHDHGMKMKEQNKTEISNVAISDIARKAMQPVYESYLSFKDALVNDDLKLSQEKGKELLSKIEGMNMSVFQGESHNVWMKNSSSMKESLLHVHHMETIEEVRKSFQSVSDALILLTKSMSSNDQMLHIQFCPMADDFKGANWLSLDTEIRNPYFGASMLTCGEVTETLK